MEQVQTMNKDPYAEGRPDKGVTIAPFRFKDGELQVLLVRRPSDAAVFKDMWALPGGFVDVRKFKNSEEAAQHYLQEKSGVGEVYMEQLRSYSGALIDPRRWSDVTAYIALDHDYSLKEGPQKVEWVEVKEAMTRPMAFNHSQILSDSVERLRAKAGYSHLPVYLLEEKFTLSGLQSAYETMLDSALDRSTFRSNLKRSQMTVMLEGEMTSGSGRPAQLFTFNKEFNEVFFPRSLAKYS